MTKKVQYRDFVNTDFEAALKKVGEFYNSSDKYSSERLTFARVKKRIASEKEIYMDALQGILDTHNEKIVTIEGGPENLEKQTLAVALDKNRTTLGKSESELKPFIKYDFIERTKIDGNDLFSLSCLIEDMPSE